jgi:hypothetical protein
MLSVILRRLTVRTQALLDRVAREPEVSSNLSERVVID